MDHDARSVHGARRCRPYCPDDPLRTWRRAPQTSYVMNGYLAVVLDIDVGNTHAHNVYGSVTNINKIKSTTRTMAMFEAADNENSTDHVHSYDWFNADPPHIFDQVASEVAVNRHHGTAPTTCSWTDTSRRFRPSGFRNGVLTSFNFAKPQNVARRRHGVFVLDGVRLSSLTGLPPPATAYSRVK